MMRKVLSPVLSAVLHQNPQRWVNTAADATSKPVHVIFGATGGVGSALSAKLAKENAELVLIGEQQERLDELQSKLKRGTFLRVDATDPAQVEKAFEQVADKYNGKIDGVANCIGDVRSKSTVATDLDELHDRLKINLDTSFNILKSAVKRMLTSGQSPESNRGGSIVLVSAALASHGIPHFEAMSAAKAGVEGLARSAAATYASKQIRINCIAPGLTKTPATHELVDKDKVRDLSAAMHPMKQLAEPQDVAAAIAFFLDPSSRFITGQVLAVDAGLSSLHPMAQEEAGI